MHSKRYYLLLYLSCKLSSFFGTTGMIFDRETRLYQIDGQAQKRQLYSCIGVASYLIFFIIRTYQIYDANNMTQEFNLCYCFVFIGAVIIIPLWNCYWKRVDMVRILNQCLIYEERFKGNM